MHSPLALKQGRDRDKVRFQLLQITLRLREGLFYATLFFYCRHISPHASTRTLCQEYFSLTTSRFYFNGLHELASETFLLPRSLECCILIYPASYLPRDHPHLLLLPSQTAAPHLYSSEKFAKQRWNVDPHKILFILVYLDGKHCDVAWIIFVHWFTIEKFATRRFIYIYCHFSPWWLRIFKRREDTVEWQKHFAERKKIDTEAEKIDKLSQCPCHRQKFMVRKSFD